MSTIAEPQSHFATSERVRLGPASWCYTPRQIAIRLFLTCWIVYALHLATNTVREIYPALAIGDHLSFRVDEYAGLHPDLFEKPGYGWHINSNPGGSMLAAIPYAVVRPAIDFVVDRVNRARAASGRQPPEYDSPWPMAREFYQRSWKLGLDVKFGLAAIVMQVLCMAPIAAAGAVLMFFVLRQVVGSDRVAFWLTVLYAFGTPLFFRTGYLNHNLLLTHFGFLGFAVMWNPLSTFRWSERTRASVCGFAAGMTVLLDYSGVVFLGALFAYLCLRAEKRLTAVLRYSVGAIGPLGLLWYYQWASFGHPLYPAQHWMAAVQWIERGYQGFGLPEFGMVLANAFDYRYGLFLTCPLLLLSVASVLQKRHAQLMNAREIIFCFGVSAALLVFASSVHYSRLQFNTGVRYMVPAVPFLFLPAILVLTNLRSRTAFLVGALSIGQAWCMAMYRDVERGFGVFDPVVQILTGGFKLPFLTVLSRIGEFREYTGPNPSPLPLFALAALIIYSIWSPRFANRQEDAR